MIELSILFFLAIISLATIVYLFRPKNDPAVLEWLKTTNARLDEQSRQMAATAKSIGEFSEIGRSMKDLQSFLA